MTPKERRVAALLRRPIEWPCSLLAVETIALEEDCRLVAYQDDAGVWTNGWGETDGVRPGDRWTQDYADERFRASLEEWTDGVRAALAGAYANEHQFAAMLCLAYNIGIPGFRTSTVLRRHKAGDTVGAARAFALWNKVTDPRTRAKREHPVLVARRAREAALYLRPMQADGEATWCSPMPQAVQAESSLAASPIAQAGAVAAGTGVLSGAQLLDGIAPMAARAREIVLSVGIDPAVAVPLLLLAAGAAAIYWRYKQRQGGWA